MPRSKAVAKKSSEKPSKKNLHSQKIARKTAPVTTGVRKHRWRPGTVALREIKRYQRSTDLLIQKAPFQRKGIFIFTQSDTFSSPLELSLISLQDKLFIVSKHQPSSPSSRLVKQQWSTFWKTPTFAHLMPREELSSQQMSPLPAEFEATNIEKRHDPLISS